MRPATSIAERGCMLFLLMAHSFRRRCRARAGRASWLPPVNPVILREQPATAKRLQDGVARERRRTAHVIVEIVAARRVLHAGGARLPRRLVTAQRGAT